MKRAVDISLVGRSKKARKIRASHQGIKYTNTQRVNRSVEESKSEMLGKRNPVEMVGDVGNVTRGCR